MALKAAGESKNKGPKIAISIACLVLAVGIGVFFLVKSMPEAPKGDKIWYYDQTAKKRFVGKEELPPIAAPGGDFEGKPGGVMVAVYSCGDCDDETKMFNAWLITTAPDRKSELEKTPVIAAISSASGTRTGFLQDTAPDAWMVKTPDGTQWHTLNSPAAQALMKNALAPCMSTRPVAVDPNDTEADRNQTEEYNSAVLCEPQ